MLESANCVALIKSVEGCRLETYDDATGKVAMPGDTVIGKLTIGYGHTGSEATPGNKITQDEADSLLTADVGVVAGIVNSAITGFVTQNEFDACVSLAFNIGPYAFARSTLCSKLNMSDITGAADQFLVWDRAGGQVNEGLLNRRKKEQALFLTPETEETS